MNVKRNIPNTGNANTTKDTAKDSIPTPIRNPLDHFEMCLLTTPCIILAIPKKNNPTDNSVTRKKVANTGNTMTANPNTTVKAPNTILPIRDDFLRGAKIPAAILSKPTTRRVIESNKTRVTIPMPGLIMMTTDKITAITPSVICNILIDFDDFIGLFPFFMNSYIHNIIKALYIQRYL